MPLEGINFLDHADDEDGDTFRNSLIPWRWAQRPPIAIYRGDVSTCRIDGPWQVADDHWLPLGGLIVTSGVTGMNLVQVTKAALPWLLVLLLFLVILAATLAYLRLADPGGRQ